MIVGHQKIWQFLTKAAELQKLSHAYLFSGQEKLGKKTLAREFVKWLFQDDNSNLSAHPDFIFVEPLQKEIKIAQIRDLIWRLQLSPLNSSFKTAIIDQAHCLNQEAQSALLKTLEEPKGNTLLILVSEYPETLFSTILSRLQRIKFHPVKRKEVEDYLKRKELPANKIKEILDISQGKVGLAVDLALQPQKLKEREEKIKELRKIIVSPLAFRFQYIKDLTVNQSNLKELLENWLVFFRKELLSRLLGPSQNSFLGQEYSKKKLQNILWQIQNLIFLLQNTNINTRLALEKLVMEF